MKQFQEWVDSNSLRAPSHWMRFLAAGVITLFSLVVVAVLWRRAGVIADPGLILLLTVAASTYLAGGMAGMLSAAIVLFCSFILFSHPSYPFRYSDLDWQQMMVVAVASPLIALMVGSLKEQVDQLNVALREVEALRDELRHLAVVKEAQFQAEQHFRLIADCLVGYAACVLDANGSVKNWNQAAEQMFGYSGHEILGQSYSRFFIKEDLLARHPERLLEQARFSGRAEEEGWRLRKGGARFLARTRLFQVRNSNGSPAGSLMLIQELPQSPRASHP